VQSIEKVDAKLFEYTDMSKMMDENKMLKEKIRFLSKSNDVNL